MKEKKIIPSLKHYFNAYKRIAKDDLEEPFEQDKWRRYIPFSNFIKEKGLVLEVGCATAGLTSHLSEDNVIVGLDLSSEYLQLTKGILESQVLGLAEFLPFQREKFDVVVAECLLEHLINPMEVIKQIVHVLKANGVFYVLVPYNEDISKYEDLHGVKAHVHVFNDLIIEELFKKYHIVKRKGIGQLYLTSSIFKFLKNVFTKVLGKKQGLLLLDKIYLRLRLVEPPFIALKVKK